MDTGVGEGHSAWFQSRVQVLVRTLRTQATRSSLPPTPRRTLHLGRSLANRLQQYSPRLKKFFSVSSDHIPSGSDNLAVDAYGSSDDVSQRSEGALSGRYLDTSRLIPNEGPPAQDAGGVKAPAGSLQELSDPQHSKTDCLYTSDNSSDAQESYADSSSCQTVVPQRRNEDPSMSHGFNKDFYVLTPTTEEETCQGEREMTQWQSEDDGKVTTTGEGDVASVEAAGEMAQSVGSVIGASMEEVVKEPGKIAAEVETTVPPPDIVLNAPEPDSAQSGPQQSVALVQSAPKLRLQIQPSSPTTQSAARKSPVTVQEWVDSIPASLHRSEEEGGEEPPAEESDDHLDLGLGAEAGLLYDALPPVTVVSPAEPSPGGSTAKGTPMLSAHLVREPSIQSDVTSHTGSHCSSVESYLESRRPDPEEVLLNLGFGGPSCGAGGVDSELSRIPRRFLQPSKVKGVAIDDFLRYQQDLVETFESGFCGYRGLTGSSHTPPSVIVAKIMEKLREHDRENIPPGSVVSAPPITNPVTGAASSTATGSGKFSRAARRVLTRTAVLGALPVNRQQQQSVLTPDNRRFLDNQGNKSPEVPRKRMIIGHRSFTIGCDGEDLIELEPISHSSPVAAPLPPKPKPLVHKDSVLSTATSLSLTSIDSDSDTDDLSSSYGQHRLPAGNPQITFTSANKSEPQAMLTRNQHIGVVNKRLSSTSISSWESEAVSSSRSGDCARKISDTISKTNPKQPSRYNSSSDGLFATSWSMKYESIHEDMETKSVPSSRPHSSDSENELSYSSNSGVKENKTEAVKEKDTPFRNMGDLVNAVIANKKSKLMRVESSNSGQYESCSEELESGQDQGSSLKEKPNTASDIEESVPVAERKKTVQEDASTMLQIRRGSLKRQQHVEDDDATMLESPGTLLTVADSINRDETFKGNSNEIRTGIEGRNSAECLKNAVENESKPTQCDSLNESSLSERLQIANLEKRGDSFEMEEICICGDDEAGATKLLRARSDSSGFLDGDSESSPARLAANGTSKVRANEEPCQFTAAERKTDSLTRSKDSALRQEDIASSDTAVKSPSYSSCKSEASQGTKQSIPNNLLQELRNTGNWSDSDILGSKEDIISDKNCNLSISSLKGQNAVPSLVKREHSKDPNTINLVPGYENSLGGNENVCKLVSKNRSHDLQCHEEMSRTDCSMLKHNVKIKDTCRSRTSSLHCIENGQLSLPRIKRTFSAPYCLHQLHNCDNIARHDSQKSLHNMFSSCSDVSVIQCLVCGRRRPSEVGDIIVHLHHRTDEQNNRESNENETTNTAVECPAVKKSVKNLSELMAELKGRGWEIAVGSNNPHFASHTDQQLLHLQGDAVRAGLAAYGHQLMGTKVNQDQMCDIPEAQKDLQNVNEVRNRIASELRHIANLLEEQPPQRAASITSQMALLLGEQTRLFQQLEADHEAPSTTCAQPAACCLLLDAVRKENQYLQSLVEKNTRELSEIRQMLKDLLAQKSETKQS